MTSGTSAFCGCLGHREGDRRALVDRRAPRPGSASAPCPGPRCRSPGRCATTLKPRSVSVELASSNCWPMTSGTSTCSSRSRPARITVEPLSTRRARRRAGARSPSRTGSCRTPRARSSISKPASVQPAARRAARQPADRRDLRRRGPARDGERDGRALVGLRPAGRVLALMTVPSGRSDELCRFVWVAKPSLAQRVVARWPGRRRRRPAPRPAPGRRSVDEQEGAEADGRDQQEPDQPQPPAPSRRLLVDSSAAGGGYAAS